MSAKSQTVQIAAGAVTFVVASAGTVALLLLPVLSALWS